MCEPSMMWTGAEDKILIEFVQQHEPLYNVKSRDYRNALLKQSLWSDIGSTLLKSGSDCCKRWSYVRDYYIRRRGKPGLGSSGEAAKKRADLLSFLDNTPTSLRTSLLYGGDAETSSQDENRPFASLAEDSVDEEKHDITGICTVGDDRWGERWRGGGELVVLRDGGRKRPRTDSEDEAGPVAVSESDEIDLFFGLMSRIVKKLPRYEQIQLRMQISSLVGNAELRCISRECADANEMDGEEGIM